MPAAALRTAYFILVGLVGLERLFELWLSTRNRRRALALGAVEVGERHYLWMVALHTAFLFACVGEVWVLQRPFVPVLAIVMLALLVLSMALRYWAIATLGERWNTRVVVLPEAPAIAGGPYRFVRHPNYIAVVVEMLALPLVHAAWITALAGSVLNVWLLSIRIRVEEDALRRHCSYETQLAGRGRWVPGSTP
ncbi:MAG: isoprenylcysteine carboxylmethyltransferase family protein [Acidobacteriota bacterium]